MWAILMFLAGLGLGGFLTSQGCRARKGRLPGEEEAAPARPAPKREPAPKGPAPAVPGAPAGPAREAAGAAPREGLREGT